jgi:8-oxo-dGTP pyrophosphatase MutT (NUDIX family)
VFGALRRELLEEASIRPDEIREMSILGMVRDRDLLQPELVFQAILRIPSKELQTRFEPAAAGQEHSELVFLFADPDAVLPFLRRMSPVAPVAEAAVLLHGRSAWGPDWYEQICYVLYGEVPPSCGAPTGRPP